MVFNKEERRGGGGDEGPTDVGIRGSPTPSPYSE